MSERIHLYLESTLESAPFYEKLGFTAEETVSLQMPSPGGDQSFLYQETIFTFRPQQ